MENIGSLYDFVYEQWLLADVRDIGECSLPSNLAAIRDVQLNEMYALQVNEVLDIAESCYSQMQKIRFESTDSELTEEESVLAWQPKRTRVLKLALTDGLQTVYGMEYEFVAALKEPFVPGFKILVMGPIECRCGVFLLKSKNVQILGGEADSLIISNATENILARTLNLSENPDPFDGMRPKIVDLREENNAEDDRTDLVKTNPVVEIQTSAVIMENECAEEVENDLLLCDLLTQVRREYDANLPRVENRKQQSRCLELTTNIRTREPPSPADCAANLDGPGSNCRSNVSIFSTNVSTRHTIVVDGSYSNEKNLDTVGTFGCPVNSAEVRTVCSNETRMLDSMPQSFSNETRREKTPLVGVACPIVYQKQDTATLSPSLLLPRRQAAENTNPASEAVCSKKTETATKHVGSGFQTSEHVPFKSAMFPVQYTIRELRDSGSNLKKQHRIVIHSGSVTKLISKPRIKHSKWYVAAEITDSSANWEFVFEDAFLEKYIFGISAFEISSQKDRMMLNSNVKERIDQLLRAGVQKMLSLTGNFLIEVTSDNTPIVVDVTR